MEVNLHFLSRIGPVALTLILIAWTFLVSPHAKYGDDWAVLPILALLPIVIIWHGILLYVEKEKLMYIAYAIIHLARIFHESTQAEVIGKLSVLRGRLI